MSRYFFNVFNSEIILDEEGIEFPNLVAAHARGIFEARNLAAHTITTEGRLTLNDRIEIADISGSTLSTILMSDAVSVVRRTDP